MSYNENNKIEFEDQGHFENYCYVIMKSHNKVPSFADKETFWAFGSEVLSFIEQATKDQIYLESKKDLRSEIAKSFRSTRPGKEYVIDETLDSMNYLIESVQKIVCGEKDISYITTILNKSFNFDLSYNTNYLIENQELLGKSSLYPTKVSALAIDHGVEEWYPIADFGMHEEEYQKKHGLYFIYDKEGELAYIAYCG